MSDILVAQVREKLGGRNPRRDRREGFVPAVVYGRGKDPIHIRVPGKELWKAINANQRIITLGGVPGEPQVAIKAVQWGTIGEEIVHVDFLHIAMDEKMEISISVELIGTPKGVSGEGILDHVTQELHIECLPGNIPNNIELNIIEMQEGDEIRLRDITPPAGVTFLDSPDTVICRITVVAEEEETKEPDSFDMPERIGESKDGESLEETGETDKD